MPAGRPKGSQNKASVARAAEIAASGITPLEFMLRTLRDEAQEFAVRLDAAKSAAPYVHPKLAAIEHSGAGGGPIETIDRTPREMAMTLLHLLRSSQESTPEEAK